MSDSRITMFNHIIGNPPEGVDDKALFWAQVKLQAKLVLEEAQEMYDAAQNQDLVEVIDGQADVWYLNEYMQDLLEGAGVDVIGAHDSVCWNNDQKYTRDRALAFESGIKHSFDGVKSYLEEVYCLGEVYYVVKRDSDNKVLKLKGHQPPNIRKSIPDNTFEKLNGF
jgi:phosphoribosyl-ATP pyrophosphohydrolase